MRSCCCDDGFVFVDEFVTFLPCVLGLFNAQATPMWNPVLHFGQMVLVRTLYFLHCLDPCPVFPHLKHPSPVIRFASSIHFAFSSFCVWLCCCFPIVRMWLSLIPFWFGGSFLSGKSRFLSRTLFFGVVTFRTPLPPLVGCPLVFPLFVGPNFSTRLMWAAERSPIKL